MKVCGSSVDQRSGRSRSNGRASNIKTRILVVSPFEAGGKTYPQVAHFSKWLNSVAEVTWVKISERGFRIDRLFDQTLGSCNLRKTARTLLNLSRDISTLRKCAKESDLVLAIDFM